MPEPRDELGRRDVVQHVRTDDNVERANEFQLVERAEAPEADVSPRAEALHHVLARVDPGVARSGTEATQCLTPAALAAADIQHGSHGPAEEVLGDTDDERRPARDVGGRLHSAPRVAVPSVEVGAVVALHAAAASGKI